MRPEKRRKLMLDALQRLVHAGNRVNFKFGISEDGQPSDWEEWAELRRALTEANQALDREAKK